ncbi:MAG: NAD(P)-dependent oxidoreductase [Candidatus Aminicenantes bacterium]|nr:NAD(P)-dependent oxidoreductase [Candidatus Aminicenantes bacterium]
MKILVTGGTGFIGQHLLPLLVKNPENQVFLLVRQPQKIDPDLQLQPALVPLPGDLFKIPPLPSDFDLVFHLAGLTKATRPTAYYSVNYSGTASLLKALNSQKKKIKFIYLSSLAAVGPAFNQIPVKEDDLPSPLNPYGRSKLLGERVALEYSSRFQVIIIRVGAVYGPGDRDFLSFFRLIKKGLLLLFDSGRMKFNLCYVKDLIQALYLAATQNLPSGEIFHIAAPRGYTWEEIGLTAATILKRKVLKIKLPSSLVFSVAFFSDLVSKITGQASIINLDKYKEMKAAYWLADPSKAQRRLGFKPEYDLKRGLNETIEWYLKAGWL